jgi:hypothetical protein
MKACEGRLLEDGKAFELCIREGTTTYDTYDIPRDTYGSFATEGLPDYCCTDTMLH